MTQLEVHLGSLEGLPVELIEWPAENARRETLARAGVPRVLLIAPGALPPTTMGVDEDWVRLPAAELDVIARATHLLRLEGVRSDTPYVDDRRVLHRAGTTVTLTHAEASILSVLLRNEGRLVSRADLEREAWHGSGPSRRAIDAAIYRLRRRLGGLSMSIRSVRGRGFVLYLNAP